MNTSFNFKIEVSPDKHLFFYCVCQEKKDCRIYIKEEETGSNTLLFVGKERDCQRFLYQLKRSYQFVKIKPL
jgi:hypothetical protein